MFTLKDLNFKMKFPSWIFSGNVTGDKCFGSRLWQQLSRVPTHRPCSSEWCTHRGRKTPSPGVQNVERVVWPDGDTVVWRRARHVVLPNQIRGGHVAPPLLALQHQVTRRSARQPDGLVHGGLVLHNTIRLQAAAGRYYHLIILKKGLQTCTVCK